MTLLNRALDIPMTQESVDFLIPDIHVDRRLGIDPFLLYHSPNPQFRRLHDRLLLFFSRALEIAKTEGEESAAGLLTFPEPNEVCLGYTKKGIAGRGIGSTLAQEMAGVFAASPSLLDRGVRHIEELQLLFSDVGPDRISDVAANVLKADLIEYTKAQAEAHDLSCTTGVPVAHFFDFGSMSWRDGYFDLPTNPMDGKPLILVPRRILRILPWINYEEYVGEYRRLFLKPSSRRRLRFRKAKVAKAQPLDKAEVCKVTRGNTAAMDSYVDRKEGDGDRAAHTELASLRDRDHLEERALALAKELQAVPPGRPDAYEYQDVVYRILTFVFHPYLVDGKPQQRTADGTLIRDLIFCNEGTRSLWQYVQTQYGGLLVVFELKNKTSLEARDIDQLGTYLGDPVGRFGVLVARKVGSDASFRRRKVIYNKESSRKAILELGDDDLLRLIEIRRQLKDPTGYVQSLYRDFMVRIE